MKSLFMMKEDTFERYIDSRIEIILKYISWGSFVKYLFLEIFGVNEIQN